MTTFATMLKRFKSLDLPAITGEAMTDKADEVLDVNREQLYEKGTDKNGAELLPYTPAYARKKQQMRGKSIVDIYLTGKLQREMKIDVNGDTYEISSPTPYTPYVLNKRPDLFGFTDDGKKVVWSIVRPDVVERVKDVTGCG